MFSRDDQMYWLAARLSTARLEYGNAAPGAERHEARERLLGAMQGMERAREPVESEAEVMRRNLERVLAKSKPQPQPKRRIALVHSAKRTPVRRRRSA
jgi:hypothetical protein